MKTFADADPAKKSKDLLTFESTILPVEAAPVGFEPQWRENRCAVLEDLRYGSIRHRIVLDQDGSPKFDFPQLVEPGGVAILPISSTGKAGLVEIYRHAVLKEKPTGSYPDFVLPDDFGVWMWEAPRGYRDQQESDTGTLGRELLEETGLHVDEMEPVGDAVTNSSYAPTPIKLFLAFVSDETTKPQHEEGIRTVRFFDRIELEGRIKTNQVRCSITLSLLLQAFVRKHLH